MKKKKQPDSVSDADVPALPNVTDQGAHHDEERRHAAFGTGRRSWEYVAVNDEAAALSRRKSADAREDSVHLREDAAALREQEIRAAEVLHAASEDHMQALQQANSNLIISTIEAHKLTEQVQMANARMESSKSAAEKANRAKSEFLSNMSHDLRTPLNAILGFAQLLEIGSPPPTSVQAGRIHQITKAGWHLLELINGILDLSLIESGKLSLSLEPVSLAEVMLECHSMIEPQAHQRGIQMNFIPFDNSWFARADQTRLKQVLINLLSNAIKYNREQGTVEVECTAHTPQRIRISIKDSGMGLSQEKLAQLFQPFNRLGQESSGTEGTGIGLVVSKQLVELMGGTINVESRVGEGSEFRIELPREPAPHPAAGHDMSAAAESPDHATGALRRLLYVEDNPANLLLVEEIIAEIPQLRLLAARDGHLGIALARVHRPDVILMDINLPGISGLEALQVLRNDPMTRHIPIIALSANAMPSDIEKGLEAGFFQYLTKPISIVEFRAALSEALEFRDAGASR